MIRTVKNAEHYNWGDNCDGWRLLKSEGLSVISEKMPPGSTEKMHIHDHAQQLFYILSGIANFEVDGNAYVLHANESIHIPKQMPHCISNNGASDLEFLVISQPDPRDDRRNI